MSLDPDDFKTEQLFGVDPTKMKTCAACRKESDGAKRLYDWDFCGTHFDEVSLELARLVGKGWMKTDRAKREYVKGYVHRMQHGQFAACWAAKKEEGT